MQASFASFSFEFCRRGKQKSSRGQVTFRTRRKWWSSCVVTTASWRRSRHRGRTDRGGSLWKSSGRDFRGRFKVIFIITLHELTCSFFRIWKAENFDIWTKSVRRKLRILWDSATFDPKSIFPACFDLDVRFMTPGAAQPPNARTCLEGHSIFRM